MRGIGFRSEALSSHFVCPSCCTRLLGGVRNHRTRYIAQQARELSTDAYSVWSFGPIKSVWNAVQKEPESPQPPFLMQALSFNLDTRRLTSAKLRATRRGTPQKRFTPDLLDRYHSPEEDILHYLDRETPDMAVYAFLGPEHIQAVTYNLPDHSFAEALSLLTPSHFVEPHKKLHRRYHPAVAYAKGFKTLSDIFDEFKQVLHFAVQKRREAGFTLGIAEYTHLLDCARAMGDADMADWLWHDMEVDGIEPNTTCYNHYMEAKGWHHAYVSKERYNMRFTPWVYKKRSHHASTRSPGYQGFGTGPENSVRKSVLQLFDEMVANGHHPDESTYINVMVASSRENHIVAVENVLKTVWNIDVRSIMTSDDPGKVPPVAEFEPSSPLHPSSRLLYAVAHIFGSNNDLSTALQLVDFISTHYNIPIPEHVWLELLEWSFVLSARRWGARAEENSVGKVPKETVGTLYETMVNVYKVKPTLPMYDMLISATWTQNSVETTKKYMREACVLFEESLMRRDAARHAFIQHLLKIVPERYRWQVEQEATLLRLRANLLKSGLPRTSSGLIALPPIRRVLIDRQKVDHVERRRLLQVNKYMRSLREEQEAQLTGKSPDYLKSRWVKRELMLLKKSPSDVKSMPAANSVELSVDISMIKDYRAMKAAFNLEQLNTSRDATIIERWVRLLFAGRWKDNDDWEFRAIPDLINEWERFLPKDTYYKIRSGVVEISPISFWLNGRRERPEKGLSDMELGLGGLAPKMLLKGVFEVIGNHSRHPREVYDTRAEPAVVAAS
ncbi:hypothetical protein AJ79_08647 [Helicocarpus griseus UAMH5409]|uniref:Pentatricopeptide repeat domain-containing protein n=1 Tax=Helicocarpus griseus UAMH5409 TaxID=1447875 RepID=A0A2B7WRU4_9EURO|nr:hypothetical protein AJ79_08647 [Helicocarpus griseus UAMH5409]